MTYQIQKKTPATRWHTIHRNVSKEFVDEFLTEMAAGGYDGSGTDGTCDTDNGTASHYDDGDLIEYRALGETQ